MAADTLRERIAQAIDHILSRGGIGSHRLVDKLTDAILPLVEQAIREEREAALREAAEFARHTSEQQDEKIAKLEGAIAEMVAENHKICDIATEKHRALAEAQEIKTALRDNNVRLKSDWDEHRRELTELREQLHNARALRHEAEVYSHQLSEQPRAQQPLIELPDKHPLRIRAERAESALAEKDAQIAALQALAPMIRESLVNDTLADEPYDLGSDGVCDCEDCVELRLNALQKVYAALLSEKNVNRGGGMNTEPSRTDCGPRFTEHLQLETANEHVRFLESALAEKDAQIAQLQANLKKDWPQYVQDICRELGVFDGARPVPIEYVVSDDLLPAIRDMRRGKVHESILSHIRSLNATIDILLRSRETPAPPQTQLTKGAD